MIKAESLFFSYTNAPFYVLNGINLDIRDGEYVSVVGENGCGKTTLMRLILKFLKPTAGRILTNAKRIGYVPQRTDHSGFPITVQEALNSYRKILKIRNKGIVAEVLEQVGLTAQKDTLTGALSGGQSQKALIARALMGSPDLLILDEPSNGVDSKSQEEFYGLIKKINTDQGVTIVSVEHNLNAAIANSTMIYHLTGGKGHLCTPRQYADEFLNKREN